MFIWDWEEVVVVSGGWWLLLTLVLSVIVAWGIGNIMGVRWERRRRARDDEYLGLKDESIWGDPE